MTEAERKDVQKSMAFDLISVIEEEPDKTYTVEELKHLIKAFIAGAAS